MNKRAFTLTEALVTLIVMSIITLAGMNIVAKNVKRGGGVAGVGCPWEVVCSNDVNIQKATGVEACATWKGGFDLEHSYYFIMELSNGIQIGSVATYTRFSPTSKASSIGAGDNWDDIVIFADGANFEHKVSHDDGNNWVTYSQNNDVGGLDTYEDKNMNAFYVPLRDVSSAASGAAKTNFGRYLKASPFKGYGKSIVSVYQQAFFCDGMKGVSSGGSGGGSGSGSGSGAGGSAGSDGSTGATGSSGSNGSNGGSGGSNENNGGTTTVIGGAGSDLGEDWDLLKKWFSIEKLKEVVAMDDSDPKKVIKSKETLLDVVLKNRGKETICGGKTSINCASYTGDFDEDHMYYVTLSNSSGKMTYSTGVRISPSGNAILMLNAGDAATFYVKKGATGLVACYDWWVPTGNQSLYLCPPNCKGSYNIDRIVAEPLE